jgi:hypothetical protein
VPDVGFAEPAAHEKGVPHASADVEPAGDVVDTGQLSHRVARAAAHVPAGHSDGDRKSA